MKSHYQPWAPWEIGTGPEYDALRLLPPHLVGWVYRRAYRRAHRHLLTNFKGVRVLVVLPLMGLASFFAVWFVAGAFGVGGLWRFLIEIAYHAVLFKLLIQPMNRALAEYLRPFIWEELLALADRLDLESEDGEHRVSVALKG